jgi:hypothetical protein
LHYREKYPDWIFIRHEDLSSDPLSAFETLFNRLNVEFTQEVRDSIERYSSAENPVESESTTAVKRSSHGIIGSWRGRLTPAEIQLIREETREVSDQLYESESWLNQ